MNKQTVTTRQDKSKSLDFASIEHTDDVTWYLIWRKYRITTISILTVSILFFVGLILIASKHHLEELFFASFLFPLTILFMYYGYVRTKAKKWFMQQFAAVNNLAYQKTLPLSSVKRRLFEVGHSKSITDVVSAKYQDHLLRLFHYHYTRGYGRSSRIYYFTVAELFFEKVEFPHILLQSRTMAKYGTKGKNMQTIPLEENFKKLYRLHATQGYEIEIFQIFTPKVLHFLKETGPHFSIEFADNRLYIYDDLTILNKKQLYEIYEVTQQIFDSIGPLLNRLHDDFAVLHPYYRR